MVYKKYGGSDRFTSQQLIIMDKQKKAEQLRIEEEKKRQEKLNNENEDKASE